MNLSFLSLLLLWEFLGAVYGREIALEPSLDQGKYSVSSGVLDFSGSFTVELLMGEII